MWFVHCISINIAVSQPCDQTTKQYVDSYIRVFYYQVNLVTAFQKSQFSQIFRNSNFNHLKPYISGRNADD